MIRLTSIEKIDLEEEIKDDTPISADNPTPAQSANDNECVDRLQKASESDLRGQCYRQFIAQECEGRRARA
jgi:hypothetical protein